jgi:hypothetical protein
VDELQTYDSTAAVYCKSDLGPLSGATLLRIFQKGFARDTNLAQWHKESPNELMHRPRQLKGGPRQHQGTGIQWCPRGLQKDPHGTPRIQRRSIPYKLNKIYRAAIPVAGWPFIITGIWWEVIVGHRKSCARCLPIDKRGAQRGRPAAGSVFCGQPYA